MQNTSQKLVVILGPTASGKTELSLQLAKKFSGYIISADSRQIYKGMNIGTGKLTGGKWKIYKGQKVLFFHNIPHFMIDIVKPDQEYSVAQYQKDVKRIIRQNKLNSRLDSRFHGNDTLIPFLVGGTGLYISAIVDGLSIPHIPPDKKLRQKLENMSMENLFKKLKKLDPACSQKIDSRNKRRLVRALEVCLKTGKLFSELRQKQKPEYDILQIGIQVNRAALFKRIDERVDTMIKQGLVKEVKRVGSIVARPCRTKMQACIMAPQPFGTMEPILFAHNDIWSLPALSSLGYKQIGQYLRKEISLEQASELIKLRTHQFAKRQMTWFKRDKRIHWLKNKNQAEKLVQKFLKK